MLAAAAAVQIVIPFLGEALESAVVELVQPGLAMPQTELPTLVAAVVEAEYQELALGQRKAVTAELGELLSDT